MNKSESKFYNTALLMNQALIEILNKKDYEFITIKEICKKAGVNRSTFYLHYNNIDELLSECIENTDKRFISYFSENKKNILDNIKNTVKEDLILITPEYLLPYLNYIKDNKIVYRVYSKHPYVMQSIRRFNLLQNHILNPIFDRFNINKERRKYFAAYYINGANAIINEWVKRDCKEEIEEICNIIIECVRPFERNNEIKIKN